LNGLVRAILSAVSTAEKDVAEVVFRSWENLPEASRFCLRAELLGFYIHWMARALFDRGGDTLRTEVGQPVIDSAITDISGGEQGIVMRLIDVINEADYEYFDVVRQGHQRIDRSGHAGFVSELPVTAPQLVDRILKCCGHGPQGTIDANIMLVLARPYERVRLGSRINEAALAWLKHQP
jgi:hypothetical protein